MRSRTSAQLLARFGARVTLWLMLASAVTHAAGWARVWPLVATGALLVAVFVWVALWADVQEAQEVAARERQQR